MAATASATKVVQNHAAELLGSNWGFNWELSKLANNLGQPKFELALKLVEAATSRDVESASTTWLNLATLLSQQAPPEVSSKALERLMNSGTARLADDVGDGPWNEKLDPGGRPLDVVVGLIWFCLGASDAASRWRAAHVVRRLANAGRWKIINGLFECFRLPNAGAFQDQALPFFILHARQWFLFAIARIAIDFPNDVAQFKETLKSVALNDEFPHVGIREAAKHALLACITGQSDKGSLELREKLAALNISKFPKPKKEPLPNQHMRWDRPDDVPEPSPHFSFDYDFEKYSVSAGAIYRSRTATK